MLSSRSPLNDLGAFSQLTEPTIATRIDKSKVWMAANLRQKDLLIVGFWSDWEYLNAVISSALGNVQPLSVTVVDLSPADVLQQKARLPIHLPLRP